MQEERKKLDEIYQELKKAYTDIKIWNQALIPKAIFFFPSKAFA